MSAEWLLFRNMQTNNVLPRSPFEKVGGLVWFGRMIDKIRLQQAGQLPEGYEKFRGTALDGRFLKFLKVEYAEIEKRVAAGGTDQEILDWCFAVRPGGPPDEQDLLLWNHFLCKMGWRDEYTERFLQSKARYQIDLPQVQTYYDLLDTDEGRELRSTLT